MLGPVRLPEDLLALGPRTWVIVSGDQETYDRPLDPAWARAVRDQCKGAGVLFFMLL